MAGFLLGQMMPRLRSSVADSFRTAARVFSSGVRIDRRGIVSAKGAERDGGAHFADSVRNDVFFVLGEKRREACATRLGESLIG